MGGSKKKGKMPLKANKAQAKKIPVKMAPVKKTQAKKTTMQKAQAKKIPVQKVKVAPPKKSEQAPKKSAPPPQKKPDFRTSFLQTLLEKQAEIKETLDRLMTSRKEYSGEHTAGDFIDEVDDAQREISAYSQYSLIERKVRELRKVHQLIHRISKEEEFGLCEECGNPIPKDRLLVLPHATLCVPCQRELEKLDLKRSMAARGPASFGVRKEMDWEGSGGGEEDDNMLVEYHIGSLPAVDIDEAEVENPPEEKEEK